MLGTLASFCLMAIGARELSDHLDTLQILFFRSVIGLIVISLIILCSRKVHLFRSDRVPLHSLRNLFHFAGQYGWFLGIGLLPLAEVFALEFTVPFWTLLVASIFLKEQLTQRKVLSIILGIMGVLIIVKPGIEIVSYASWIVLGSAMFYAFSHTATKSLSTSEDPMTILFMMCLIQLPIGFFLSIDVWQNPINAQWFWLVVIGLTALTAHYCMTKAMQHAEVSVVVVIDFMRLPLIALVGVALYSESFEIGIVFGAALMLVGNLLNFISPKKLITNSQG
ncbi:MAG: DMT family transporter [Pseudomonadales bacterium]|nr:DMT family transporter [Pseudomonadales bacterium]